MDLAIRNARVVTEQGVIHGGLAIDGESIVYVGPDAGLPHARRVVDARGHYAIPGLIDAHVHLLGGRRGALEDVLSETFPAESMGGLIGGVTTAGLMISTSPHAPVAPRLETFIDVGHRSSRMDFFAHAVLTSEEHVDEIPELAHGLGCWSFKHFFNANKSRYPTDTLAQHPGIEIPLLFRSLEIIAGLGAPAIGMVHCEDQDLIWLLEDRLKAAGRSDLRAWAEARPGWLEALRMRIAYELAQAAGAPLYCVHIASAEGVDIMAEARRAGYPFWGETCPHYLTHTADMEDEIGCWGRVNTAIKFDRDRDRLWEGIKDGSISNMGTDHGSFMREVKEGGGGKHNNIWGAKSSIASGMEHLLPVLMTYGVQMGRIDIEDLVRVCCKNNASVFGLYPRKGVLREGSDADIVLIDPEREVTVTSDFYHGLPDWSIYYGHTFKGLPYFVTLRGTVVVDEGEGVAQPGTGRYLNPAGQPVKLGGAALRA